ncbi:hypothetical protein IMG5_112160 [Ichthyophthirius multifiliis]|uniref:Uncharacterized protein n=1 Tax=Ichthyophthirius multifiliis TaxID=5932 RepID=G0QTV8_ICHMU|nr:hypothetical protein IMG5_112160 [Ichthyophthirius multifiliis]EGR31346.1 hypothetical protein IMG5_112160 [Ichthyophthirius multifiliis]|eukprot:XP_004034832.1 hypothetical protein IMG5_112160 [Ichthyophthirius multifiliis]
MKIEENEEHKKKFKTEENPNNENYILEIHIKKLLVIQNVFSDGSVVKKILKRGIVNTRMEKISRVYFSLKIEVDKKIIYESGNCDNIQLNQEKDEKQIQLLENENQCMKFYIDEYKISRLLKRILKKMKKQEEAVIVCKNNKLITYGEDCNIIKNAFGGIIPETLVYYVKVYDFTEGKNTYTMTIEENYKKALKTFENINGFFDLGRFLGQDAIDVHPFIKHKSVQYEIIIMGLINYYLQQNY